MSSHILVVNHGGLGHVIPTLDVVAELCRRGHRVTYVTRGDAVGHVAATGATVLEYDGSALAEVDMAVVDTVGESHRLLPLQVRESEAILRAVGDHVREKPDLILYDATVYHAGRILSRRWGVPAAVSCATLSSNEHFSLIEKIVDVTGQRLPPRHPALTEFATRLLKLLAAHGQSHVSLEEFIGHTEGLHVAFFPRSFQYAGDTFDDRFVFVGPYLGDTTDASWAPPQDGTPLLVVTLGTSVSRNPAFFRTCALALGALPYRVLINVGSGVSENDLGALPPNVRVHGWLPLNTVLAHAAAYVCHAGMGSLMGAFVHGTPVVAVPRAPEQVVNAARVADLGLGRTLSHHEFTPERLRGAVREVVADPAIREQLAAMREDILTAGGGRRGADAIEQYMAVTGHAGRGARWT